MESITPWEVMEQWGSCTRLPSQAPMAWHNNADYCWLGADPPRRHVVGLQKGGELFVQDGAHEIKMKCTMNKEMAVRCQMPERLY